LLHIKEIDKQLEVLSNDEKSIFANFFSSTISRPLTQIKENLVYLRFLLDLKDYYVSIHAEEKERLLKPIEKKLAEIKSLSCEPGGPGMLPHCIMDHDFIRSISVRG